MSGRVSSALILAAIGPEPRTARDVAAELHASQEATRRTLAGAAREGKLFLVAGGSGGRDAFYSTVPNAPISEVRLSQPRKSSGGTSRAFPLGRSPALNAALAARLRAETDAIGHVARPATRGDCAAARGVDEGGNPLPCPWVSCKHHLAVHVTRAGTLEIMGSAIAGEDPMELDLESLRATCSLDVADETRLSGDVPSFEALATVLDITRERVRQIEVSGLAKGETKKAGLRDFAEEGRPRKRLPILVEEDDGEDDEPEQTSLFGYLG